MEELIDMSSKECATMFDSWFIAPSDRSKISSFVNLGSSTGPRAVAKTLIRVSDSRRQQFLRIAYAVRLLLSVKCRMVENESLKNAERLEVAVEKHN
jgi:hypothetical protein